VVLRDPDSEELRPVASRDRMGGPIADIRLSRKVVQRVLDEKRAVLSCDATGLGEADLYQTMAAMRIRSFICAPLIARDQVLGILQLDSSRAMGAFSEDDLSLLTGLASQAALAIQNARYDQDRRLSYLSNIGSLLNAVEARDGYTRGHSMRVADFSVMTALRFNTRLPPERAIDVDRLRYAAQLHDAGKISLEVKLLHKPSTLDQSEFEEVKRHPLVTYFILSAMHLPPELKGLDMLAALHHERWDGLGYPCGLKGDEAPIESRILAAADMLDAMTSDRPYRKALPLARAMEEMQRVAGTQLDPQVVDVLRDLDSEGALATVLGLYRRGDMTGSFTPLRFREMVLDQLRQP
jgi:HD-GYP domain-containing protein (c-di-GMP phosphodiesterase class II)